MNAAADATADEPDPQRRPLDPKAMGRVVDQLSVGLVDYADAPDGAPVPATMRAAIDQLGAFLDDPTYAASRALRAACLVAGSVARVGAFYRRWAPAEPGRYEIEPRRCCEAHPASAQAVKVAQLVACYLNQGPDALTTEIETLALWASPALLAATLNEAALTWGRVDRAVYRP